MHIYKQIYPHTHTPTCDLFTTTKSRQAELVMLLLWVCNGRNTVQLTVSQSFGKGGRGVFRWRREERREDEDIVLSTATGVPGVLRQRRLGAGTKDLSEEG